ncbi:MAG: hypothetical protein HC887_08300 [Desulfobacteraceae bacterium]|nr:hypothetical protein [Desulfobacteraceae bacterium]
MKERDFMFSKIRVTFLVSIIAASYLLISCTAAVKKDSVRTITIIGTADLQGMLDPLEMKIDSDGDGKAEKTMIGGISRISSLIHQIRSEQKDGVIAVSTGDDLMNRYFHVFKAEAIFKLMSEAGYDFYAPGNHEFDK